MNRRPTQSRGRAAGERRMPIQNSLDEEDRIGISTAEHLLSQRNSANEALHVRRVASD